MTALVSLVQASAVNNGQITSRNNPQVVQQLQAQNANAPKKNPRPVQYVHNPNNVVARKLF